MILFLLDIIHRLVFIIKNNVSETGFCLRPQVKPYSVGPDRQSYSLSPEIEITKGTSYDTFVSGSVYAWQPAIYEQNNVRLHEK
jgi:hypothetical protein